MDGSLAFGGERSGLPLVPVAVRCKPKGVSGVSALSRIRQQRGGSSGFLWLFFDLLVRSLLLLTHIDFFGSCM